MPDDPHWMLAALSLARRNLGRTWPNPSVGCVLVRDGRLLANGWTQPGGRPHAEVHAISRAGQPLRGATAYVTLEPCSHHGRTPPCADALVDAGLARVVVATVDPDGRVAGQGIERLKRAGLDVTMGVCGAEAEEVAAGFLTRIHHGRPLVTLKLATSLDGRIALASNESRWITGPAARAHGHFLRATNDAIAVGIGTVLADDPLLNCRLPGLEPRAPLRIVFDAGARLPPAAKLAATARQQRTIVLTADAAAALPLRQLGVEAIAVPASPAGIDPAAALKALGDLGLTRLLVEGGGRLAASLLAAQLVDRIAWYRAPMAIGGDGVPGIGALALGSLVEARAFVRTGLQPIGPDVLETYRRSA
ncbi:MAG: bifunctional diaminohydroxyphosphoribosylaminopyrimidine deaminase/5-amino-6-(5-phosphoribosylamino)uracil reductase RibD [Reyranellaceae bacterium]